MTQLSAAVVRAVGATNIFIAGRLAQATARRLSSWGLDPVAAVFRWAETKSFVAIGLRAHDERMRSEGEL